MTTMKKNYKTREEMERDQGKIMLERMKERAGQPRRRVEVGKRDYSPKTKTGAKK